MNKVRQASASTDDKKEGAGCEFSLEKWFPDQARNSKQKDVVDK